MSEERDNPYASPQADESAHGKAYRLVDGEAYADGRYVVVMNKGSLPARCVTCGETATQQFALQQSLRLTWEGIVSVDVAYGMCELHVQRSWARLPMGPRRWDSKWAPVALVILAVVVGGVGLLSFGVVLGVMALYSFLSKPAARWAGYQLEVHDTWRGQVWIRGAGEAFLKMLPPLEER